ncbi:hemagglutinin, partial [Megasphaera lornae]
KVLEKLDQAQKDATDYQLVENESAADKKYSVNEKHEIVLQVKDTKHPNSKVENVTITDVAKKSEVDKAINEDKQHFKDYAVKYDKNNDDTVNKNSITLAGNTTTGTAIHNVAKGDVSANSKDAVNGSQLFATQQTITNVTNNLSKTNQGFDVYITDQNNADNTFTVKLGED